ncbi:MAG: hypothetical protein LBF65_02920 [Holosporales bacterium]|nr:hypothetical protein [Holosporales bacterium]
MKDEIRFHRACNAEVSELSALSSEDLNYVRRILADGIAPAQAQLHTIDAILGGRAG